MSLPRGRNYHAPPCLLTRVARSRRMELRCAGIVLVLAAIYGIPSAPAISAEPASGADAGNEPAAAGSDAAGAAVKKPRHGGKSHPGRNIPSASAHTGVFGIAGQGSSFVYVFDASGSMSWFDGRPLASAKRELLSSLDSLGKLQQFQIIFYNDVPHAMSLAGAENRPIFANEANKDLARKFVASIQAEGSTQHMAALSLALRMRPDVIYFLTDGDEPQVSNDELSRVGRLNDSRSVIHVIQLGHGEPPRDNWLMRLARENNGQYKFVDIRQLTAAH